MSLEKYEKCINDFSRCKPISSIALQAIGANNFGGGTPYYREWCVQRQSECNQLFADLILELKDNAYCLAGEPSNSEKEEI